jgi:hypothetical protein
MSGAAAGTGLASVLGVFPRPTDLDVGRDGRIYVVDFGKDRVQVFAPLSGAIP